MTDKPVDEYPLSVVGTIRNGKTYYYIQNLVTGERDFLLYDDSAIAHEIAHYMHIGDVEFYSTKEHEERFSFSNKEESK